MTGLWPTVRSPAARRPVRPTGNPSDKGSYGSLSTFPDRLSLMHLQKPLRYEPRVKGGPKSQFTFRDVIVAARPQQWTKNSVCLAALIFAGRLGNLDSVFLA